MDTLIRLAPVLGCLAIGAMMWFMVRGNHGSQSQAGPTKTQEEINLLRAEINLLKLNRNGASKDTSEPGTQP